MNTHLVVCAMRNEGPFILEWVAWQKMLGFDDILIAYNDCTDHSPQMLAILEQAGWVTAIEHHPRPGRPPQASAFHHAARHPLVQAADWMFICDVDEFLILHAGDGTLPDFVGPDVPDVAGIAIHWKCFGDSGLAEWHDGLTHRTFTHAAPEQSRANIFFKSLIYQPRRFGRFGTHSPRRWQGAGAWNEGSNHWIRSNGARMSNFNPDTNAQRLTRPRWVTHTNAQLNHYVIRTRENFEFKRGQLSASSFADRYTDDFLACHNRNDEQDLSALAYAPRFDPIYAEICALPGIMRLHHLCCADYIAAICARRGDDPRADLRWIAHMDQAASAG